MIKYQRFLFIPAVILAVGGYVWAQSQTYNGNSNISVGTTPVVVVNQGGKVSYALHNRTAGPAIVCWPIATNSAPAASPTPGAGVPMIEVPAGATLNDQAAPEQPRDPLTAGWACSEPTSESTAAADGVWR